MSAFVSSVPPWYDSLSQSYSAIVSPPKGKAGKKQSTKRSKNKDKDLESSEELIQYPYKSCDAYLCDVFVLLNVDHNCNLPELGSSSQCQSCSSWGSSSPRRGRQECTEADLGCIVSSRAGLMFFVKFDKSEFMVNHS